MSKKLGNDYLLWIESATPGTYNLIAGQQNLSMSGQAGFFDTSTKDDSGYATQAPGLRAGSINFECIPNLPDANGYTRMETRALAAPQAATLFQIRKGGSAGNSTTDVVFAASMYIGDWSTSFGQNDAVKTTATLSLASAPTTNVLS